MKLLILNSVSKNVPREFLNLWWQHLEIQLRRKKILSGYKECELVLVFLSKNKARALNKTYRGKDYATDVLSFNTQPEAFGDLVFCPEVLTKQAKEHQLTYREELAYMLTHGVLHLLGYEHEKNAKEARQMFELQDRLFEDLCRQLLSAKSKVQ